LKQSILFDAAEQLKILFIAFELKHHATPIKNNLKCKDKISICKQVQKKKIRYAKF